ncbi:MAG: GNAT family N-acetyltransferase [Proteobacteria bacterium]|nr:GNAT family N-acetyltransferase [Pseudomonadota bacterium]
MFETITEPLYLEGTKVKIRSSSIDDAAELYEVGKEEKIWTYMVRGPLTSEQDAREFLDTFIALRAIGQWIPFAVLSRRTDKMIGFTCYLDIQPDNESLEIGYTFLHPDYWSTGSALECQLLLAQHAVENLGAGRVVLKTDGRNRRVQRSLEHFGITKEGVLRKHMRVRDGFLRDTVMYSLLRDEWPEIKKRAAVLLKLF